MAPEIWMTGQVDSRTDLYALGVTVYQMLTGQLPFPGPTPHRIMYAHLNETPPPLHVLNPALSPAVEKVLLKILAKSPAQRYQTAAQFCADLQAALIGRSKTKDEMEKKPSPVPQVVWLGGVVLLVVLVGMGLFLFAGERGGSTTNSVITPVIETVQVELDDQPIEAEFQEVTCGESHRLEIKLLDVGHARIEPGNFAYTWRFEPGDSTNEDSLNSGNYAKIYQVPCELKHQTVIMEILQASKTLSTKSVNFNIIQ